MRDSTEYVDDTGTRVRVEPGLGGDTFMAMRVKDDGGGRHRVKSPNLPPRPTAAEAQTDLDAYAAGKGWRKAAGIVKTTALDLYPDGREPGDFHELPSGCGGKSGSGNGRRCAWRC